MALIYIVEDDPSIQEIEVRSRSESHSARHHAS